MRRQTPARKAPPLLTAVCACGCGQTLAADNRIEIIDTRGCAAHSHWYRSECGLALLFADEQVACPT